MSQTPLRSSEGPSHTSAPGAASTADPPVVYKCIFPSCDACFLDKEAVLTHISLQHLSGCAQCNTSCCTSCSTLPPTVHFGSSRYPLPPSTWHEMTQQHPGPSLPSNAVPCSLCSPSLDYPCAALGQRCSHSHMTYPPTSHYQPSLPVPTPPPNIPYHPHPGLVHTDPAFHVGSPSHSYLPHVPGQEGLAWLHNLGNTPCAHCAIPQPAPSVSSVQEQLLQVLQRSTTASHLQTSPQRRPRNQHQSPSRCLHHNYTTSGGSTGTDGGRGTLPFVQPPMPHFGKQTPSVESSSENATVVTTPPVHSQQPAEEVPQLPDSASPPSQPDTLPPIGVFWDIENCQVPSGKTAMGIVQKIRTEFFAGHKEAEFMCVCDISKESREVIQELNNAQVTVVHINATAKNAADDKLRQSIRRFADTYTKPATVVLVSGDVNFASELSDLRHRHKFRIVLLHTRHAQEALLHHAHHAVCYDDFVRDLPFRSPSKAAMELTDLLVSHLPIGRDSNQIRNRLKQLSDNCGGRVLHVSGTSALIRFPNTESANRAKKRMEKEDVFGSKITVALAPKQKEENKSPTRRARHRSNSRGNEPSPPVGKMEKTESRSDSEHSTTSDPEKYSHHQTPSFLKQLPRHHPQPPDTRQLHGRPGGLDRLNHSDGGPRSEGRREGEGGEPAGAYTDVLPSWLQDRSLEYFRPRQEATSHFNRNAKFRRSVGPRFDHRTQDLPLPLPPRPRSASPVYPMLYSAPLPRAASPQPQSHPFTEMFYPQGVDLEVRNLDPTLGHQEMRQTLLSIFREHCKVLKLDMLAPHEGVWKAMVKVPKMTDATLAISQVHRRKVGSKRIHVMLGGRRSPALQYLRSEVTAILNEAPGGCLPLFKFTEIYEKRYNRQVHLSDLHKLTDVVQVKDQGSAGRVVCLTCVPLYPPGTHPRLTPSPAASSSTTTATTLSSGSPVVVEEEEEEEPFCKIHCTQDFLSTREVDHENCMLPDIVLSLKAFAAQVHTLLQTHDGRLPLLSFQTCYNSEIGTLPVDEGGRGVPVEHLISCVPGVNISHSQSGNKTVKWAQNRPPLPLADACWPKLRPPSPAASPQLIQFSRDVVDLLKTVSCCRLPFSRFIPTYHHHFGRQCKVADYGFTKLVELFEAVPHVLQILGYGSARVLTLTHRAQVKRFTQDVLRLLKSLPNKEVTEAEFPAAFHGCHEKTWDVRDYGVCEVQDLLCELPENTVEINNTEDNTVISLPRREQTPEEVERTKRFAREVVELLRRQPHCRMPFNKFIPAYHHHFSRQCRLSDYGFSKLIDLFEAVPQVVQVLEGGEERNLVLAEGERIKVLSYQLVKLLRAQKDQRLQLGMLIPTYARMYGYTLRLQDYDASSIRQLLEKVTHVVRVEAGVRGAQVVLIDRRHLKHLSQLVLALLMDTADGTVPLKDFPQVFVQRYRYPCDPREYGYQCLADLLKAMHQTAQLKNEGSEDCECEVVLTPLYHFARDIRVMLLARHCSVPLATFSNAFQEHFRRPCRPQQFGFYNIPALLAAIPQVVNVKGRGNRKVVVLRHDMRAGAQSYHHGTGVRGSSSGTTSPSSVDSSSRESSNRGSPTCLTGLEQGLPGAHSPECLPESAEMPAVGVAECPNADDTRSSSGVSSAGAQETEQGHPSEDTAVPDLLVKGSGQDGVGDSQEVRDLMSRSPSPVDLLSAPIPPSLPSPVIWPDPVTAADTSDLIKFTDSPPPTAGNAQDVKKLGKLVADCTESREDAEGGVGDVKKMGKGQTKEQRSEGRKDGGGLTRGSVVRRSVKLAAAFSEPLKTSQ
ncbi:PREDICTED: meiosis arrest female protein 1 homolog [Branchiostoma belcheri]|uniref:Meiosis arrest female protein 1 homolog n=1 Tax=Branchiostoma belcheri TaxID=7741 RepID=A0A6P4XJM1_BRABE|nr:PREDICTED: meiosis arrest female protein 1 homolog [Branchiostoma belcheri]